MARPLRLLLRCTIGGAAVLLVSCAALYLLPLPGLPAPRSLAESTKVLDRDGRVLYDSAGPAEAHHTYVPLEEMPAHLKHAVIATEDASFYSHPGVDVLAVARAALTDLRHLDLRSGASTVTQQLARNLYFDAEERASASPQRKLREALLALGLERTLSKDDILEQYLNRLYFGNLAYGVEAASRTYFGKGARDLDLAESALLAGLLQSPTAYDPFTQMEAAKGRQWTVLTRMLDEGYLSRAEAEAAWAEPLALNPTPFPMEAPHFVAWVLGQLPVLVGDEAAARGDLRVYTSLDLDLQRSAQAAVAWHVGQLREHRVTSGAVVALDPASGEVLAMVGSADYFDADIDGAVNMALAERQPGSAIKPVVYAAALEAGFTPASPLLDVPTSLKTRRGEPYAPNNYDATFHGVVPLRDALASSYNVPAVRVLAAVGVDQAFEMGRRLGLTTFRDRSRYDLSLTLGGAEVRLLDLTAAYAAFAAAGGRVDPVAVLRVKDGAGNVLYQAQPSQHQRVVSPQTAYLISDILSDNDARAPTFGLQSPLRLDRPAAVKTGTTSDFRDNWTVGYTPDLAVGVWVGNADNIPMRNVSGVEGAAPIWRDVMQTALKSTPTRAFTEPEGIERVTVCLPSGLLPTAYCPRQRVEVFRKGTAPAREDDYYRPLAYCDPSGLAVAPADPPCPGPVTERVFAFVPLEAIPWAREAGIALPPVPPYTAAAAASPSVQPPPPAPGGARLRLVSPADGAAFHLSRELRPEEQALRIEALLAVAVAYVDLYVDGAPIERRVAPPYKARWQLSTGVHEIRARAVDLSGTELWSEVATVTVLPP